MSSWSIFSIGVTPEELARQLKRTEENIVADVNAQLQEFADQVQANLNEASQEWDDSITALQAELKAALEAVGVTELSPQVQAALQTVREKAQAMADKVPNVPDTPPAEEEPAGVGISDTVTLEEPAAE